MSRPADAHESYSLGVDEGERQLELSRFLRPTAERAVLRLGVVRGWHCLDVGCGPLGILDVLAERSRPSDVTGLEREPRFLAEARRSLELRGLSAVRLELGDATSTTLPADGFDLAHARLVLCNTPNPGAIVAEMARVVRPGGYLLLQDISLAWWTCEPPHPDWDRLRRVLSGCTPGDTEIGEKLLDLLADAGLEDVHHSVRRIDAEPAVRNSLPYFARKHRRRIVDSRALNEAELDASLARLDEHLANPAVRAGYPPLYQAWGRKPLTSSSPS